MLHHVEEVTKVHMFENTCVFLVINLYTSVIIIQLNHLVVDFVLSYMINTCIDHYSSYPTFKRTLKIILANFLKCSEKPVIQYFLSPKSQVLRVAQSGSAPIGLMLQILQLTS